jgi:hypothetical protein
MIYNAADTEVYKAAKKMLGDGFKLLDVWKKKIAPEVWDGPAPPDDPLPPLPSELAPPSQSSQRTSGHHLPILVQVFLGNSRRKPKLTFTRLSAQ